MTNKNIGYRPVLLKPHRVVSKQHGFTIVELLVVIVVIGILAAITIVSYSGITQRANVAALQSDLTNNSKKLKMYYALYGHYPTIDVDTKCPITPNVDDNYCLKASSGNTLTYTSVAPITFHLNATKNNDSYSITSNTSPAVATSVAGSPIGSACPTGFIPVPGSGTYGTNDFCVMKYEAKNAGSNVPVSQASGSPWVDITQTNAITYSQNVVGCTGCHLISEAEWLTIAQNVLSVVANWRNGAVGTGEIYQGHSDNSPPNALAADTSGDDGYYGTGDSSLSWPNQRRILTLTNNEVIWDISGNVLEWTQGVMASGQQPGLSGEVAFVWKEWNNGSLLLNGLSSSATPGYTGITGASGWSSVQKIGQLLSNYGENDYEARRFLRGGDWDYGHFAGVLSLSLQLTPYDSYDNFGFRVAR